MTSKPSSDQRFEELVESARKDEEAGRWDSASLKWNLAKSLRDTPEVAESLARVAARGARAYISTQTTPAPQAAPSSVPPRTTPGARPIPTSAPPGDSTRTTPAPQAFTPRTTPVPRPASPSAPPPVLRQSAPAPVVRTPSMPMMLLSVLHRQSLVLGAGFATRYPHPWLVWELGPHRPAGEERNVLATVLPSQAGSPKAVGTDPLCFALFGPGPLRVGRADGCSIVVDDVTFSRDLGVLVCVEGKWAFDATAGGHTELDAGSRLQNGDVTLSFETSESFARRLTTLSPG
ncbi:MAG: hypothetical protein Q8N26_14840 [Myxococcales bacterium]|nr:hypothetical protein [Myxococcales bacterium]